MPAHEERPQALPEAVLRELALQIRKCKWFTTNNLNRDFVGTRGFSIAFHATARARVVAEFPWLSPYLDLALRSDCNAFYLNPLQLELGSRVDPHIDRSLHAYCLDLDPPVQVSVLYLDVPAGMVGGELELRRGRKFLARVRPQPGLFVRFDGDLMHGVNRVDTKGLRLSLVCEQYALNDQELAQVPEYRIESRVQRY